MALYIGNPTNVVVSQAYGIGFLEYSAWMLLPTVVCTILAYITMRVLFRSNKYIPRTITCPDADPKSVLVDPFGAVFGVVILGCCLGTLIGTSFIGVEVWQVTLPFAVVMFIRDVVHDVDSHHGLLKWVKNKYPSRKTLATQSDQAVDTQTIPLEDLSGTGHAPPGLSTSTDAYSQSSSKAFSRTYTGLASPKTIQNEQIRPKRIRDRLPTLYAIAMRMPWKILPFALGMFILVEALSDLGWTAIFATALARITPNYVSAVFAVTFISLLSCQLLNNLPMTILFTRIMQHPNFTLAPNVTPVVLKGCIFSLVIGSNLGACFTLVGSLAGIM
jgi:Na+/H+ antiporter NhaD/arsenite permease-like protein